eukprot:11459517-Ditylum_brightwellii.AAC.1
MEKARKLVTAYITQKEIDRTTGEPTLLPKTEIEEHDLEQNLPSLSEDKMKNLHEENFNLSTSKCCIGLDRLIYDAFIKTIFNASNVESDLAPPSPTQNGYDNGDTDKFIDEGSTSDVAKSNLTNDNKSSPRRALKKALSVHEMLEGDERGEQSRKVGSNKSDNNPDDDTKD